MRLTRDREAEGRAGAPSRRLQAVAVGALVAAGCDARIGEAGPGLDAAPQWTLDASGDAGSNAIADASETPTDAAAPAGDGATTSSLPPVAKFAVWPAAGTQQTEFAFDAGASRDPEDPSAELTFAWDWDGDGSFDDTGLEAAHSFAADGLHTVTLRVENSAGVAAYTAGAVLVAPEAEVIVVTTAADVASPDDGETSLREAIAAANELGPHTIVFAEPMTIALGSTLPTVTDDETSIFGGAGVVIDGEGQASDCLGFTSDRNRVMWLEVRGCGDDGIDFAAQTGNVVSHCKIHDTGDDGIDFEGGAGNTIGPGNEIVGNAVAGIELHGDAPAIFDNWIDGNGGPGVRLQSNTTGAEILGNTLTDNAAGVAVDGSIAKITLHHNTIAGNAGDGLVIGAAAEVEASHDVRNNLITHSGGFGIRSSASFAELDHNGYFANEAGHCEGCPGEPNSQLLAPKYIDALAGDLRLAPDSPYIDAGRDLGHDVNGPAPGAFFGDAPDVGAAESPE